MQSVMENIKVQENYFYKLDNLKEVKIIWKKYDKANILEIGIDYPTAIVDLDRLLGVELTEEWLYKLGFDLNHKGEWFNHFCTKNRFNISHCIKKTKIHEIGFYFEGMPIELKYVHQLQALFFSWTGRELTVA